MSHFTMPDEITIAIDTEFEGAHTLTIQVATRAGKDLIVQLYRSPLISDLPNDLDIDEFLPPTDYFQFFECCELLPTRLIHRRLSPSHYLVDLLQLAAVRILSHYEGKELLANCTSSPAPNVTRRNRRGKWIVTRVEVRLLFHFQPADFFRCLGREFLDQLIPVFHNDESDVAIQVRKLMSFVECGSNKDFRYPVVEYIQLPDGRMFEIRVATSDTILPFGNGSLNSHCKTFLGFAKSEAVTTQDKQAMRATFDSKTLPAYGYAITDPVNTLLVHEVMTEKHRELYRSFDFANDEIPPMRPTLGSRVSEFIVRAAHRHAEGSQTLGSLRAIKRLMGGGGKKDVREGRSRFGPTVASVHGGLLFTRSSTRLWHDAANKLRDVDYGGCYNRILQGMNLYCGRPIILEPGRLEWKLADAVDFSRQHADDDAWMIRVTGCGVSF